MRQPTLPLLPPGTKLVDNDMIRVKHKGHEVWITIADLKASLAPETPEDE